MRFIFSNSLKPYPRRLYMKARKTGRSIVTKKYRIEVAAPHDIYIAINGQDGHICGPWARVCYNTSRPIEAVEA